MRPFTMLLLILGLALAVAACSQAAAPSSTAAPSVAAATPTATPTPTATSAPSASPAPVATPSPSASSAPTSGGIHGGHTVEVEIRDFAFEPQVVQVMPGATVRWTNFDGEPHTVRSEDAGIASAIINKSRPFEWTAPGEAGTFAYICGIHTDMTGTIEVGGG